MKHSLKTGGNIPTQIKGGNTMKKFSIIVLAMLFVFGMATAAMAASYNDTTNNVYYAEDPDGAGPLGVINPLGTTLEEITLTDDEMDNDNGLINSNNTGVGAGTQATDQSVIKNVDGQATHGAYQTNTNSCASCHQTHTAAESGTLLFKDSIYNTCTACHDGTLGFYNVFTGSTAGTFAGTQAGNASMHLANGTVEIEAAPAGNNAPQVDELGASWTAEFDCASCHLPHGSYSDRLLNTNPNKIQSASADPALTADYDRGGKRVVNLQVYGLSGTALPGAGTGVYTAGVVYSATKDVLVAAFPGFAATLNAAIDGDDYVAVLLKDGGATWSIDTTPWLYGYTGNRTTGPLWTALKKASGEVTDRATQSLKSLTKTTEYDVDASAGGIYMSSNSYVWIKKEAAVVIADYKFADISKAVVVKFPSTPATAGDYDYKVNTYSAYGTFAGAGANISYFCGGCHGDYVGKRSDNGGAMGMYSVGARHTTTSADKNCLICHYAHGTDVTVMTDALDRDYVALAAAESITEDAAKAELLDQNPSSALKRYTNMAVCWKCHSSSIGVTDDDYFANFSTVPHGWK